MTITAPEGALGPSLEHKAATETLPAATTTIDVQPEGVVTAIVAVTGVVDEVKDIIEPGAFSDSLSRRRPKVVWAHSWTEPVGRVLTIEEWRPGDPRLPRDTKDGRPWPKEAGALVATMQFNLTSDRGKAAFQDVAFYSETKEAEYSIGYQVPAGASVRTPAGIRRIRRLDLYELSPVLFGAAPLSMTLSLKTAAPGGPDDEDTGTPDVDPEALHAAAASEIAWDELPPGYDTDPPPAGHATIPADAVADGMTLLAEAARDDEIEQKRYFSTAERNKLADRGAAMDDGSYPIANATDLANAVQACGRAKDKDKAKAHIIKRARALGLVSKLPEDWNVSEKGHRPWSELRDRTLAAREEKAAWDESLHPRGSGGKFAPKDSSQSADRNKDGLPDDWLAQIMKRDSRYAANAAKKKGKGKAKSGRAAQRAKDSAADQAARAKEMARRDRAEAAFEAERDAEMDRRAAFRDALADETDKDKRTAMQAVEREHRRAWDTDYRKRRAAEREQRRSWENQHRQRRANRAQSYAAQTKSVPAPGRLADPDEDHPYFPGEDGLGCADCDLLVDADVHNDPPEIKAAMRWAEDLSWLDPPIAPEPFELEAKEGGADRNRGNADRLRRWYLHEAGIPWGQPGDWSACVAIASRHMSQRHAKGYCQLRHMEATGEPAGRGAHGGRESKDDSEASMETKLLEWCPTAEVGESAAHLPAPEVKRAFGPELHGTLEERRERVRAAVTEALRGGQDDDGRWEWDNVTLLGTWPERVVAQRENYDAGADRCETYEMDYEIRPDGTVQLSEPRPVELEVTVVEPEFNTTVMNAGGEPREMTAAEAAVLEARYAVKALLAREVKEGRVLSRINLSRLRQAITALLNVLEAAGVEIDHPTKREALEEEKRREPEPVITPDTTSASAREEKAIITADELAAGLALLVPTR